MKKKIIIGVIILLVLALCVGSYFIFFNKDDDKPATNNKVENITITFDSDGGSKVEDMKVKKGTSFTLPETTKERYTFVGWYNGSTLYTDDDTASIKKNIVLTAKWEETKDKDVVLTVTFDSKGGSKVKDMTFKCSDGAATIKNLPKSKKDSYNFLSWEDKHGKSILDGAKIVCEGDEPTLKLYAIWEYDGPTANPEQDPNASKIYKCSEGTLKGDKCVITKDAKLGCDKQTEGEYNGKCYNVNEQKPATCRIMTGSTTPDYPTIVDGKVINNGSGSFKCVYNKISTCDSSHKVQGICYEFVEDRTAASVCQDYSGYTYIVGNALYDTSIGRTNVKSGCYKPKEKHYVCESGYELSGNKCTKTINATLE